MKKFFHRHAHTDEQGEKASHSNGNFLPISILVAAVLIAGAMVYSAERNFANNSTNEERNNAERELQAQQQGQQNGSIANINPVTKDDYVRGNRNAPIFIVEYSDLECPFCKVFHDTMKKVVNTYGDKVAWVYRNAPLVDLHSKAKNEAEALECAGDLGGNDVYWAFADRVMELTPSNNGLDAAKLPEIAEYVGLNRAKFESCLASGKFSDKIDKQFANAMQSGFRGTPYSVIIVNGTPALALPGALPFTLKNDPSGQKGVSEILDGLLEQL